MHSSLKQGKAICSLVEGRGLAVKGATLRKRCVIYNAQRYNKIKKRGIGATYRKVSLAVNSLGEQYGLVETGTLLVFTSVVSSFLTVLASKVSTNILNKSDTVQEKQTEDNDATREGAEGMSRSFCANADEVWEAAWGPFRDSEDKEERIDISPKERPLLWLEAVDDKERWILLSICLECLQLHIPKLQQTCRQDFVDKNDVVDYHKSFLMQVAADASNKWLGYTPLRIRESTNENQQSENLDETRLMLYGLEERSLLYLNIVKIMNSWFQCTRESKRRGEVDESTMLPVNSRDVTNLRCGDELMFLFVICVDSRCLRDSSICS